MKHKLAWLTIMLLPHTASALYFVHDTEAIARASALYAKLSAQYQQVNQLRSDAEGHYGFGNMLNSDSNLSEREWSASSWSDALHSVSGGNPARYQQLLDEYNANNKYMSTSAYAAGSSVTQANSYSKSVASNRAAAVQSNYEFADINNHLKAIHKLSGAIEHTQNEKAAMDLNARLTAELAYIQVEEVKMQTILNEQMVDNKRAELDAATNAANFAAIPKEDE